MFYLGEGKQYLNELREAGKTRAEGKIREHRNPLEREKQRGWVAYFAKSIKQTQGKSSYC
jgi:hypothetical protein